MMRYLAYFPTINAVDCKYNAQSICEIICTNCIIASIVIVFAFLGMNYLIGLLSWSAFCLCISLCYCLCGSYDTELENEERFNEYKKQLLVYGFARESVENCPADISNLVAEYYKRGGTMNDAIVDLTLS